MENLVFPTTRTSFRSASSGCNASTVFPSLSGTCSVTSARNSSSSLARSIAEATYTQLSKPWMTGANFSCTSHTKSVARAGSSLGAVFSGDEPAAIATVVRRAGEETRARF